MDSVCIGYSCDPTLVNVGLNICEGVNIFNFLTFLGVDFTILG